LFHSQIIICESDSDCRFCSAILSSIHDKNGSINPDILFVPCGGKQRIPVVVKSLVKVKVHVKVISDFDVFNNITPLKSIFEELVGKWKEVENDWKLINKSIEQKRPELGKDELKERIDSIIKSVDTVSFPQDKIDEIQKVLKKVSPWATAKEGGKSFIPSGNSTTAFERIQKIFKEKGLFIVEVGELESFVKSLGNHEPKWLTEVLLKNLENPEFDSAKEFIFQVIE
jgi:hypothetical protein